MASPVNLVLSFSIDPLFIIAVFDFITNQPEDVVKVRNELNVVKALNVFECVDVNSSEFILS